MASPVNSAAPQTLAFVPAAALIAGAIVLASSPILVRLSEFPPTATALSSRLSRARNSLAVALHILGGGQRSRGPRSTSRASRRSRPLARCLRPIWHFCTGRCGTRPSPEFDAVSQFGPVFYRHCRLASFSSTPFCKVCSEPRLGAVRRRAIDWTSFDRGRRPSVAGKPARALGRRLLRRLSDRSRPSSAADRDRSNDDQHVVLRPVLVAAGDGKRREHDRAYGARMGRSDCTRPRHSRRRPGAHRIFFPGVAGQYRLGVLLMQPVVAAFASWIVSVNASIPCRF